MQAGRRPSGKARLRAAGSFFDAAEFQKSHNPGHQAVLSIMLDGFDYADVLLHDFWTYLLRQKRKFALWLEDRDEIAAANTLIVHIQRATGLLGRQLAKLEGTFAEAGGIREKMTAARLETRAEPAAPPCLECGEPMRRRGPQRGAFRGCAAFPPAQRHPPDGSAPG